MLLISTQVFAQSKPKGYSETTSSDFRVRAGVNLEYKLSDRLSLFCQEELRAMNSLRSFDRAMTTVGAEYAAWKHLDIGGGYTLVNALKVPSEGASYMGKPRHRAYLQVEYSIPMGQGLKLSLRERVQCTFRTDSVNVAERANPNVVLRSRAKVSYKCRRLPLVPYGYFELYNTLNGPYVSLDDLYVVNGSKPASIGNYICRYRASAGVKYRFNRHTSLSAYYLFDSDIDYDVNITRNTSKVNRVIRETEFRHILGVELSHRF